MTYTYEDIHAIILDHLDKKHNIYSEEIAKALLNTGWTVQSYLAYK